MKKGTLIGLAGVVSVLGLVGVVVLPGEEAPGSEPAAAAIPSRVRTVSGAVESPPSFRVAGVMVNAPTHASQGGQFEELAFLGTFSKTRLAIELHYPAGGLIDLKRDASALDAFQDDAGNDLIDHDDVFGPFEMMPRIAEDTRSMVFVVGSKSLPGGRSARLQARGTLRVSVADETVRHEAHDVALEAGSKFRLGPFGFEVKESGASDWNEGHWSTTLETRDDPAAITGFWLVVDGEELEWKQTMSMSGGSTWTRQLETEREVPRATVRIEAWKAPKTVDLPFDVSAGLGLR